jgi:flagellar basal body-associated protein FliL
MAWWIAIIIALVLNVVAYLIMPKPKTSKPEAAKDLENPTAEAGRPLPVIFGTVTVKGLNILWYGDKNTRTYKISA